MAWTLIDNIRGVQGERGVKGEKGDAGVPATITGAGATTLPAGSPATVTMLGSASARSFTFGIPRGDRGDRGPAGTIGSASAESVPADENAAVIMSGTAEVNHAHFKVPRGLPGLNGVPTDEAVATYLLAGDTAAGGALRASIRTVTRTVNAADFGVVGDGLADDTAALNAAIAATPTDGRLIIPTGTYRLSGSMVLDKGISVDAAGATFVQTTVDSVVVSAGVWDTAIEVASTAVEQVIEGVQTVDIVRLNVAGTAPYVKGDIVKLFGDDIIPGTLLDVPSPEASNYRVGQFFTVFSVDPGIVRLRGVLRDPITTTIRVAKLNDRAITWDGGKFISTYESPTVGTFKLSSLINPTVRNVEVQGARGQVFSFVSCLGYNLLSAMVKWAINDESSGFYGYCVDDNTSEFGYVEALRAFQPRSGFTSTATRIVAGNTNPAVHGRTYGTKIVNSVVEGCSSTAFDSHSIGERITFQNCLSIDNPVGFQLRGRNHRLIGCEAVGGNLSLRIAPDASGGESYGHVVDGFVASNPAGDAITVVTRHGSAHPNYNVRDTRRSYLRNVIVRGCATRPMLMQNTTVQLDNVSFEAVGEMTSSRHLVRLQNAHIVDSGSIKIDTTGTVAGVGMAGVIWSTGGAIFADLIRITGDSAMGARIATYITGDLTAASIGKLVADYAPGTRVAIVPTSGTIDWETVHDHQSSRVVTTNNLSATYLAPIKATTQDVTLIATITSAQTLGNLPAGCEGQELRIINDGSANVMVTHGSVPNTTLIGGTSKTVAPGAAMLLIYRGTWRQIALV